MLCKLNVSVVDNKQKTCIHLSSVIPGSRENLMKYDMWEMRPFYFTQEWPWFWSCGRTQAYSCLNFFQEQREKKKTMLKKLYISPSVIWNMFLKKNLMKNYNYLLILCCFKWLSFFWIQKKIFKNIYMSVLFFLLPFIQVSPVLIWIQLTFITQKQSSEYLILCSKTV